MSDMCNEKESVSIEKNIGSVFKVVLTNLIRNRNHLGLLLNYEIGNITEQQYTDHEKEYDIKNENLNAEYLAERIKLIYMLTDKIFNAEEISTMFNCDIESAERAIDIIIK